VILTKVSRIMSLGIIIVLSIALTYTLFQVTAARRQTKNANKTVSKICSQVKELGGISTKKRSTLSDLKKYRKVMALCVR